MTDIPRRAYIEKRTSLETAINNIIATIERDMPGDERLTAAQMHLDRAFRSLADFNDEHLEDGKAG